MKRRILFVITDLFTGGAEMMLLNLLAHLDGDLFDCQVVSLRDVGPIGARIQALGIPVHALEMRPQRPGFWALARLVSIIRQVHPHVVSTWMYHADLLGSLATRFAGRPPLVWTIHHTRADPHTLKPATRRIVRLNAWLSNLIPARIICCAQSALQSHAAAGYARQKMVLIPNGFDLRRFQPDPQAAASIRQEMRVSPHTPLVGLCARFHPAKDHQNFLRAAKIIAAHLPDARFVLCGQDITAGNAQLTGWIRDNGLQSHCILLGPRDDMPAILAGLDLLVSASRSEAFPLIIGEAMACGVPCVVTAVGDSALIVGDSGLVVPPLAPEPLAEACLQILALPPEERQALGQAARARIEVEYNLPVTAEKYGQLFTAVATKRNSDVVGIQSQS